MDYLPTDETLSEFFTRPLQGTPLKMLIQIIMVWHHISILKTESKSEFKELVENDRNGIFNPEMDLSQNWTQTCA